MEYIIECIFENEENLYESVNCIAQEILEKMAEEIQSE